MQRLAGDWVGTYHYLERQVSGRRRGPERGVFRTQNRSGVEPRNRLARRAWCLGDATTMRGLMSASN